MNLKSTYLTILGIWKNTELVGVGISIENGKSFIVCNYYPPGNVYDEIEKEEEELIGENTIENVDQQNNNNNITDKKKPKKKKKKRGCLGIC